MRMESRVKHKWILRAEEMADVDRHAIEQLGIPGAVLMEQAGRAVADICLELLPEPDHARVIVVCGRGNNGGDGFVVARRLAETVADVRVVLLAETDQVRGDALLNLQIWQRLGHPIEKWDGDSANRFADADLIVDAMLGTGARGNLREPYRQVCRHINAVSARVVAVDLPTGVDANTGACDPDAVQADATVTFGALKPGLIFSPGYEHAGRIVVADIGFPHAAFEAVHPQTFYLDEQIAGSLLPERERTAFKNRCGQIYVLAGSMGMGGAAYLCSRAALRAGAGLVILGCPDRLAEQFEGRLIEVIKEPLAQENGQLAKAAWQTIEKRLDWADAIAAGPGLGTGKGVEALIQKLIAGYKGITVLDADGINVLAGRPEVFKKTKGTVILTPHPGEFSRLTGLSKDDVLQNPIQTAREFAETYGVYVLLKGAPSVAALPSGEVFINGAGNPGMASAGMGDVLTGVIAGLAGQTHDARSALLLGMFVHSRAGDAARESLGELALNAGDVLDSLANVFSRLEQNRSRTP